MKTRTIVSAVGLIAAATLLVAGGAHARRADHRGAAYAGWDYYYEWGWGPAAAAGVAAKAAARAAYDARDPDYLHRCYQPQRIWNGPSYTWRLVSIC
jgi:hypothetical protein